MIESEYWIFNVPSQLCCLISAYQNSKKDMNGETLVKKYRFSFLFKSELRLYMIYDVLKNELYLFNKTENNDLKLKKWFFSRNKRKRPETTIENRSGFSDRTCREPWKNAHVENVERRINTQNKIAEELSECWKLKLASKMAVSHSLPVLRRSNKIFISNDYLFSRLVGKKASFLFNLKFVVQPLWQW